MTDADRAEARSRAYALFGRLYVGGIDDEMAEDLADVPGLADVVPAPFDADQAASAFQELFGFNVFPTASVYLDPEGRTGGRVTDDVRHHFAQAGFDADTSGESADHIGHELAFLAFLSGAESDALADGLDREDHRIAALQRQFLDTHLLVWLPAFAHTVARHPDPFFTRLAELTLDLVVDHRGTLPPLAAGNVALPDPPDVLADPKTGLRDIARYLMRPAWSGLVLTRRDLTRLGRAERLPRGFGDRAGMLEQLLRSAVDYERLPALLESLHDRVEADREAYAALAATGIPSIEHIAERWTGRLEATRALLDRLEAARKLRETTQ